MNQTECEKEPRSVGTQRKPFKTVVLALKRSRKRKHLSTVNLKSKIETLFATQQSYKNG